MTPQELVDELYDAVDNDDMCNRSYLVDEVEDLCAENAKLRELVRDMYRDFADADYELKRDHGRTFMAATRYEQRIRELGVDDG